MKLLALSVAVLLALPASAQTTLNVVTAGDQNMVDYVNNFLGPRFEKMNPGWDDMWDSFCVLAKEGGPAHRATLLGPDETSDVNSPEYKFAQQEIIRGIFLVSGLKAQADKPGWIAVECQSEGMAAWLAEAGIQENVQVRAEGNRLLVPCGQHYGIKGEIKNVVTVVAKTTHYWADHVPNEVKTTMKIEEQLSNFGKWIKKLFGR